MVAPDPQDTDPAQRQSRDCLTPAELAARLREEVSRASRQRTQLSCLLVSLQDTDRLARLHGEQLPRQALLYLGSALRRELRNYDRVGRASEGELLVLLPGADERRGEIVARRALGRFHAVKLEADGERSALRISVGIAAWHEGLSSEQLLSQTRLAAQRETRLASEQPGVFEEYRRAAEEESGRAVEQPGGPFGRFPGPRPA